MEKHFGNISERPFMHVQRLKWTLEFDRQTHPGQVEAEEKRFLEFVQKRLFHEIPKDLKDTRGQIVQLAESLKKDLSAVRVQKAGSFSAVSFTSGTTPVAEVVDDIGLWCRQTAETLKKTVYPDSNPRFKPVSTEVIAEAVEYYLLNQLQEVSNASEFFGLGFFNLMPDVMCAAPGNKVFRDHKHVLNHLNLLKYAAFYSMRKMDEMEPSLREHFQDGFVPLLFRPDITMRLTDNLVSFTKQDEFKPIFNGLLETLSPTGEFLPSDSKYVASVLFCLIQPDNPDYRRELALEVLRNTRIGMKEIGLEVLRERSLFDETTQKLMSYNPYALEGKNTFALKDDYPGVRELDESRREILLKLAVAMKSETGHNNIMVNPLIKILKTHPHSSDDLERLSTTFCWFIHRTKDQCPKALEGLEGESCEVKSQYLQVLVKFPAPGAEADFIKKRLKDAEGEGRKLAILKEEDQRASKPIDDMLR